MFNFSDYYLIDPAEIVLIEKNTTSSETHPYKLSIELKTRVVAVSYADQASRDRAATFIENSVDNHRHNLEQATNDTVRALVSHEVDKLRRDIRELKQIIRTGASGR